MSIHIEPFCSNHAEKWDLLCETAFQSTLIHTRKFLNYHGSRFEDRSSLVFDDKKLIGVLPAALAKDGYVVSHPGITYGGLVHSGEIRGSRMIETFIALRAHYISLGATGLIYKAVPHIYHSTPAQDDLYALFRLGARLIRSDLNCAINLRRRITPSERRRRSLNKARKSGVKSFHDNSRLNDLWSVINDNLSSKHSASAVHTLEEIRFLSHEFPSEIRCFVAVREETVVAGVIFFVTRTAYHAQYIASNSDGYKYSALDDVFDIALNSAISEGKCWLAFGTSNEDNGRVLNDGLYKFKSEFGGGGVVHEQYQLTF